jgi:transposase
MYVADMDLGREDFKKLYQTESDARGKVRYLALHNLQQGKSKAEVCRMVCITRHTIDQWLKWHEEGGIERLREKIKGRGLKPKVCLSKDKLQIAILKLQSDRNGGRVTGNDIKQWIKDTYQTEYHLNHIYNILKGHNLSWVSSRSIHPNTDISAQESFKKTSKKKS